MNQIDNSCLECDYNCYKKGNCSFDNYNTSEDVYDIIKSRFISEYDGTEGSLKVSNGNNFVYQITTVNNELDSLLRNIKSDLSVINLKECGKNIKCPYEMEFEDFRDIEKIEKLEKKQKKEESS